MRFIRKRGSASIEAVVVMSFLVFPFFLFILAGFCYLYPYVTLEQDVQWLAKVAERQGGLTPTNIETFRQRVRGYAFMEKNATVTVVAKNTTTGADAGNVTPFGESGSNYVSANTLESIRIRAETPAVLTFLPGVTGLFGATPIQTRYFFEKTVLSMRP